MLIGRFAPKGGKDSNARVKQTQIGRDELLRIYSPLPRQWCDKTMSVLREQQLEACQERLTRYPDRGLFDRLDEADFTVLFSRSYFRQEIRVKMPSLSQMRQTVLNRLPMEVCFLSENEDALVKRMLMDGGSTCIFDWEEVSAAEALVSRLWCTLQITPEDTALLKLPKELLAPLTEAMMTERYARIRQQVFSFDATLHSLLYLSGFLHAQAPAEHFLSLLGKELTEESDIYVYRHLRAAFDYIQTPQGDILLLHPGLAEPEHLFATLSATSVPDPQLTQEMVLGGMNGILPEEVASCETMRGALAGAVRPEYDAEEVLEDLRMMAKQGASIAEMREVLESALCVIPTPRMLSALTQLHLQTVRWTGMRSAVLN